MHMYIAGVDKSRREEGGEETIDLQYVCAYVYLDSNRSALPGRRRGEKRRREKRKGNKRREKQTLTVVEMSKFPSYIWR